jgi:hypothetical protein
MGEVDNKAELPARALMFCVKANLGWDWQQTETAGTGVHLSEEGCIPITQRPAKLINLLSQRGPKWDEWPNGSSKSAPAIPRVPHPVLAPRSQRRILRQWYLLLLLLQSCPIFGKMPKPLELFQMKSADHRTCVWSRAKTSSVV